MAFIYKITNDINDKVYIGKTEFSLEKRFKEHCNSINIRRCEKRPLYNAMKKHGTEHFSISLIEEADKPEEREIYWIQQYNSFKNGYNATMGGDSKKYIDYDEVVQVYRDVKIKKEVAKSLGINVNHVGHILKNKNEATLSSKEISLFSSGKPVSMISSDGAIIKTFNSLSSASQYIAEQDSSRTNVSGIQEHIKGVCVGRRKTAYGYSWKFEEPTKLSDVLPCNTQLSLSEKTSFPKNQVRPVQMFSISGEYINSFNSIREAGRYVISQGITNACIAGVAKQIRGVCIKKIKTAYGYVWRFAEQLTI